MLNNSHHLSKLKTKVWICVDFTDCRVSVEDTRLVFLSTTISLELRQVS